MVKTSDTSAIYDFLAGIDPTGIYTVRAGRKNKEGHLRHKAIGAVGGFLGGAAAIPAAISAITSGIPKYMAAGKKGTPKIILHAALDPYRKLGVAIKANKELALHGTKDSIGTKNIRTIMGDVPAREYVKSIKGAFHRGGGGIKGIKDNLKSTARRGIISGAGIIGLSGAINSGASIAQYDAGQRMKKKAEEYMPKIAEAAINYGLHSERELIKHADGYGALDFLAGAAVGGGLGAAAGELTERHVKKKIINALQKVIDRLSTKKIGRGAYIIGAPMALAGGMYAAHKGNSRRKELRMRRSYG